MWITNKNDPPFLQRRIEFSHEIEFFNDVFFGMAPAIEDRVIEGPRVLKVAARRAVISATRRVFLPTQQRLRIQRSERGHTRR
jgi:hypothetical protein